jgi:ATP-dependent Clp protease adaptor protein ClpS
MAGFSEPPVKKGQRLRTPGQEFVRLPRLPVAAQRAASVGRWHDGPMKQPTVAPDVERESDIHEVVEADRPWLVIVWNDPINLMTYVTYVFQKLFGYPYEKAHKLMLDVHYKGKAVVSSGPREKAEMDCFRLHGYGLWATLSKSE